MLSLIHTNACIFIYIFAQVVLVIQCNVGLLKHTIYFFFLKVMLKRVLGAYLFSEVNRQVGCYEKRCNDAAWYASSNWPLACSRSNGNDSSCTLCTDGWGEDDNVLHLPSHLHLNYLSCEGFRYDWSEWQRNVMHAKFETSLWKWMKGNLLFSFFCS